MSGSVHPKSGSARGLPDHLHHRLLKSGLSHRAAATWLYVLSLVLVALGLLLELYREYTQAILLLAYVAFACVIVRHLAYGLQPVYGYRFT